MAEDLGAADGATGVIRNAWTAFRTRERFALTIGSIIAILLTLWLASTFDIPQTPRRGGALLQQPAWPIAMGITWIAVIGCTAVASIVASRTHYEGGLFCACIGLAALSVRMGPSRFALFQSNIGAKVYLLFAIELFLIYIAIAIAWLMLRIWTRWGLITGEPPLTETDPDEPIDQNLLATAAQVVVMIVLMILLCRTDQKPQVIAAVGVSSYLAALAAHHYVVTRPSIWFWAGPLVVGVLGYVAQYFSPTDWMIGDARGSFFFANLARPMPLDYAGVGPAAALLGYWTSQRWHKSHEMLEATA
ncbi:MAG TPA: hypothetical protein VH518_14850 [Tepidisphaeraceae bacterium]|jgi:hypothetical protein